jgi:hypothetical protein
VIRVRAGVGTRQPAVLPATGAPPDQPPFLARIAAVVGSIGLGYALVLMVLSLPLYRHPAVAVIGFGGCVGLLLVLLAAVTRNAGRLPGWCGLSVAIGLYIVDVVMALVTPPAEMFGSASWNIGAIAILLLCTSPYRPVAEAIALGVGHAAVVVAAGLAVLGAVPVDPAALVAAISGAAVPVLVAAPFLRVYQAQLGARRTALRARAETETAQAVSDAVRRDSERRLALLRADVVPLLAAVSGSAAGSGAAGPGGAGPGTQTTERARRLAEGLRRELVDWETFGWLRLPHAGEQPPVEARGAIGEIDDAGREFVVATLAVLYTHGRWERLRLTAAGAGAVRLVLVAEGPAAGLAAGDRALDSLLRRTGATSTLERPDQLLVEAQVQARPQPAAGPDGVPR